MVYYGDEKPQRYESSRCEYEYERPVCFGKYACAKHSAGAEQFAYAAEQCQRYGEAASYAYAVKDRVDDRVARGISLGASEKYAVNDDERYEYAEAFVERGQVGLHEHLKQSDKGGYDHYVGRYAYLVGHHILYC